MKPTKESADFFPGQSLHDLFHDIIRTGMRATAENNRPVVRIEYNCILMTEVIRNKVFTVFYEKACAFSPEDRYRKPEDMVRDLERYSDSADRLIEVVGSLRDKGFKIEMDDFGAGYSSLNMLTEIPIDVLKIDMQFIRRMLLDDKKLGLVRLVMDIARFLHVPVVAEGVEEEEQLNVLRQMGCDIVQGYYFSPPLPAERFGELINQECQGKEETSC